MSTAMVRVEDIASKTMATVDDLKGTLEQLKGRANVLSPVASVSHIKPLHMISLRAVSIDPVTECYQDAKFCKADEVALSGVALSKLMAAAGANIVTKNRLDDRSDPHYCEIEIWVAVQDFDGSWRQVAATKVVDLRVGSEDAKTMKPNELSNARRQIQSLCESKALNRALRKLFSLRSKYTKSELARPWVVPKLVANLDLNDPEQKTAAIKDALNTERSLFGPGRGEAKPMVDVDQAALPAAPPAKPGLPPPPVGSTPRDEDRDDDDGPDREQAAAGGDTDDLDFGDAPTVCGCVCGHQVAIEDKVAGFGMERFGRELCIACYPGKAFDLELHKDVRGGDLKLPKMPELTVQQIADAQEKARKTAGAKR